MAIRERLLKQLQIVRDGLNAMPPFISRDLRAIHDALVQARDLCFQGLSENRFVEYKDTYDGLLLAAEQLAADASDKDEIVSLCSELLQYMITQTQKETAFKKEIFFLPYKASMWDSLESVWKAADEDKEHCIAYVMPIPYADLTPEHTVAEWHCERDQFPKDVPTVKWEDFDLKDIHPDVIFIHNPYDGHNYVTSVESRYYSSNLKPCTDLLVYIPYYATTGGMAEMQRMCPAYLNADYIVIQSPYFRKLFDESLPDEKFLPFGSPKFDRSLQMCMNPPQAPKAWEKKMRGRKVYFYNTSLGGMLYDTGTFLQKMEYVFQTFKGRKDACLIWRPHPLMESTFSSMRKEFYPQYTKLRKTFIEENIGIYDDTPDIEKTIALSDVYIGDDGTSVTSLFAVAGKPLFLLNNFILSKPNPGDYMGVFNFVPEHTDEWLVSLYNVLYHREGSRYRYICNLSRYAWGSYYLPVFEQDGSQYVCSLNAQDVLKIADGKIEKRIPLERRLEQAGAFANAWQLGKYIFLLPIQYPAVVRLDTVSDAVGYVDGLQSFFAQMVDGEWRFGGSCVWRDKLVIASPVDDSIAVIDAQTMELQQLTMETPSFRGCMEITVYGDELWLVPYAGDTVICWQPNSGKIETYRGLPDGFACRHIPFGFLCDTRPFGHPAVDGEQVILPPYWGNMFVRLDRKTGKMTEWKPTVEMSLRWETGYYFTCAVGMFLYRVKDSVWRFFHAMSRRLYDMDIRTGACTPVSIDFDETEVAEHSAGFRELAEWLRYGCKEDAFNSLEDLLDGNITGPQFNKERQLRAYGEAAANLDGTCGEKVYQFVMNKLNEGNPK